MIKFAMLCGAMSVAFLAGGRTVYSGLQLQMFTGTALKTCPDPSNIWSFHQQVTVQAYKTTNIPILVDFDNNGKMDSDTPAFRVMITDIQVTYPPAGRNQLPMTRTTVYLRDDNGIRWDLTHPYPPESDVVDYHFRTPLVLPVNSGLHLEVNAGSVVTHTFGVNMIGRLVSM